MPARMGAISPLTDSKHERSSFANAGPQGTRTDTAARRYHAGQVAEAFLLALIVVVPVVIHWNSRNMMDVKDIVLGLGAGLGLALWLAVGLVEGRLSWPPSRLTTAVLAFVAWAGISVLYSQYPWVAATEFGHLVGNVSLFLLVVAGVRTLAQIRRLALAAAISAVAGGDLRLRPTHGARPSPWATSTSRIFSFLGNATYLAGYLVLVMPLLAAIGWPERREEAAEEAWLGRWWLSLALGALLAAMLIVLLRTVTISAFIGLALGLLITAGRANRPRRARALRAALLGILGLGIVLALFSSIAYRYLPAAQRKRVQTVLHFKDPSSEERQLHWRTALRPVQEPPRGGQRLRHLPRHLPLAHGGRVVSAALRLLRGDARPELPRTTSTCRCWRTTGRSVGCSSWPCWCSSTTPRSDSPSATRTRPGAVSAWPSSSPAPPSWCRTSSASPSARPGR